MVTVAGGRFAPGHIGELTRIVPFEMVDAAVAQTRAEQQRVRDLPSRVVVYLLLAGALFGLLRWWIDGEMPLSVDQTNDLFRRLAIPALKAAVR